MKYQWRICVIMGFLFVVLAGCAKEAPLVENEKQSHVQKEEIKEILTKHLQSTFALFLHMQGRFPWRRKVNRLPCQNFVWATCF